MSSGPGDGEVVRTPAIAGFFPDPSICRVGGEYFTAHSSFEYVPGVPIFRSSDLTTWEQVGNALTRPSQLTPSAGAASSGVYAPTLRHHDGRFWLVTTDIGEFSRGHLLVSADDPAGPWSDAVHVEGTLGIDPDLMWDDEGTCRLTWKSFDPAHPGIVSAPLDLERGVLLTEPVPLWQGTGLQAPEGPHLYRIADHWYLLLAEGGTERGHAVTVARARELDGPWEAAPTNPVLTHRSTDLPVQNVGHADLVQGADGSWAMVYHGVRPRGRSPLFHVNGRETFVAGVEWVEGWPVVQEGRFRPEPVDHSFDERFEGPALHPRWVSPGVSPSAFTALSSDGATLRADGVLPGGTALLGTRTRDERWTARARLGEADGVGRLVLRIDDAHWYGLTVTPSSIECTLTIGPATTSIGSIARSGRGEVELRISALPPEPGAMGIADEPDAVELAATRPGGEEHRFGSFAGRYLSTEVAGGFTGRVVGVEAVEGEVLLRSFEYRTDDPAVRGAGDAAPSSVDDATMAFLLDDPDARTVLDELVPGLAEHPFIDTLKPMRFDAVMQAARLPPDVAEALRARLTDLLQRDGAASEAGRDAP